MIGDIIMERISYEAIRCVFYIMFKAIEKKDVNEYHLQAFTDFLNVLRSQVDYHDYDINQLKDVCVNELICIDSLRDQEYKNELINFLEKNLLFATDLKNFFADAIDHAKWVQEIIDPLIKEPKLYTEKVLGIIDEVHAVYKEYNGSLPDGLAVICPVCEKETTNFSCDWSESKHVYYRCEHCYFNFMM